MIKKAGLGLVLVLILFPGKVLSQPPASEAQDLFYAGSAKAEITPPPGTPLSGYGKLRGKKTSGTHDPLFARALSLKKNGELYVLVSLDLCLVDKQLGNEIHRRISEAQPLDRSRLLVTATHTHSGSGAIGGRYWQRFIMGDFQKTVFDHITRQASEAALASVRALQPASAEYGETNLDELIENRMKPELRFPRKMKILRFVSSADKSVLGEMVFMAAHPTLFPAKELLFSADYPGLLTSSLESSHPGAASLFINGAAGDLRPHAPDIEDRKERLTVYGNSLAEKARNISFSAADLSGPWKHFWIRPELPPVEARAGTLTFPPVLGGRIFPRHAPFQAFRFGSFAVLAFPGEIVSEIGYEIERRVSESGLRPLLAGYANDYIGYVVCRRHYEDTKEYEARVSFYGRGMETFVHQQSEKMIDGVLTGEELLGRDREGILDFDNGLPVLHLTGSPYHRGYEEGRLLKTEIRSGMERILAYFRGELKVPFVNRMIIRFMGDRAWNDMAPYVRYDEYRQIEGLADGAGVPLKQLLRIHAMPELFPTLCANGAYWGEATLNGKMIAIRNLDWNRKMTVQALAAVKVFDNRASADVINIGYAGFSGILSGMNSEGLSAGQIGAESADETMEGVPMPFLIKRILEESSSLEDAKEVFRRSNLTRGYNYVIADASEGKAMAVEATHTRLAFFQDMDPAEQSIPYALPVKNAVFRGDPAMDPDIRNVQKASKGNPGKPGLEAPEGSAYEIRYLKQGQLVKENYGSITPETAQKIAREIAPGSNIQSVIFAYPEFQVANAVEDRRAVDSPYHTFNINDLLRGRAEKVPD